MHLFEAPELESMTPFGWANPESIRPLVEMVQRSFGLLGADPAPRDRHLVEVATPVS
jgi:hypothetical protein